MVPPQPASARSDAKNTPKRSPANSPSNRPAKKNSRPAGSKDIATKDAAPSIAAKRPVGRAKNSLGTAEKATIKSGKASGPKGRALRGNSQRRAVGVSIPDHGSSLEVNVDGRGVTLTNLDKPFWPELGITKGDLLRYYQAVAPVLLPHLRDRAMVMKRYPNGAGGEFFFMKRAPSPRPEWLSVCAIAHASGSVIEFPVIQDLASLMWVVNLGCIDLNPWYSRADDIDRPDFLHFDLDPVPGADFERVRETALILRATLERLDMQSYAKTSGSKGIHVYVPIVRGPTQKQVWTVAKTMAQTLASLHPELITAEYRIAKRPPGRVLVDYNQNAWGRTLASVYSVRPRPLATVSAPVTWKEIEQGVSVEEFTLQNMPERIRQVGDLWQPLLASRGRTKLKETIHVS